ncbi:MAG: iron-containing alcohol dehydrogenase, partial [Deltaproteobacteria bacterium]|nr:iron-containing alcohol dehydrogenase [Deltaproteobacteria bacterium]
MRIPTNLNENIITFTTVPVKFGLGAAEETGYEVKRLGAKKVLICTDKTVAVAGHPDAIKSNIEKQGIGVDIYDNIHIEPTDKSIEKMAADLQGTDYDLYLALGGGSVIDSTKITNLLLTHPAPIMDYLNKPIGLAKPIPGPLKPTLAMPTTAGTGSETTSVAVLDLLDLKNKGGISHPCLRPDLALVDPLLTVSMSPEVTASTGMDALMHALESYTSLPFDMRQRPNTPGERAVYIGSNPFTDMWCEKAIENVGTYLRRAVAGPHDLEARFSIAASSVFAGIGFGNSGVHIPHSMAYPLAGMVSDYWPTGYEVEEAMIPHGQAVTITAPAAFRFTAPIWPEKHAHAAWLLGADIEGLSDMEAAMTLPETLIQLMQDIGFPNGISAMGYTEADIRQIVEGTLKQQRMLVGCPRPVGEEALIKIARESMKYW